MLQCFHTPDRSSAAAVNLARFDETLTVLDAAPPGEHTPAIRAGRDAVDAFLATLRLRRHAVEAPPAPAFGDQGAGAKLADSQRRPAATTTALEERRTRLRAYVEQDGWTWDDVAPS